MTKREEIKEALRGFLCEYGGKDFRAPCPEDCIYFVEGRGCDKVYGFLHLLHSQGVVIKVDYYVDGTLVECPNCGAGFLDKVEPLIEDEPNKKDE